MRIVSNRKYKNHVKATWLSSFFVLRIPLIRNPKEVIVSQKIVQSTNDISKIVFIVQNLMIIHINDNPISIDCQH